MATPGINTKVKMDGEKEYRAALAQINAGLKNIGAEMRATEQDFADNADSVEALTAKGDVLTRQMQTQQEKVDTLRENFKYFLDRKSTRLNSSHNRESRMPSSA